MFDNNNTKSCAGISEEYVYGILYERYAKVVGDAVAEGFPVAKIDEMTAFESGTVKREVAGKLWRWRMKFGAAFLVCLAAAMVYGGIGFSLDNAHRAFISSRCILENNFFLMEIARPVTDCDMCKDVTGVTVLENATRESFARFAYTGRPVLAKGAARSWNATRTFNFDFFKRLYETTNGALQSVDDECQFFPFRTQFLKLSEVFQMPEDKAKGKQGQEPWYIGWSNCDPHVAHVLRKHYSRPSFLPSDSEASAIDWIFMGWSGRGSSIHLDYVQRPSWQAQISGRKSWRLFPTPECEHVCSSFRVTVEQGDIVLIDTNQWYHDTFIEPGEISITIGSEYD